MSSNLNGINGLRGTPITPATSSRPVGGARAVVRVTPTAPAEGIANEGPLSRSGLPLEALFGTEDLLETREAVPRGATAMGLAQARTALLRQLPGDALAALDDVWTGAQRSEEGWYLRGGALTVLGLPGEGERVAGEGLDLRPTSVALRYLQSVARSMSGDWSGARVALAGALDASPHDPVLRLQLAVVLARQGHLNDASELIAAVQQQFADHPAVGWARAILRSLSADRARSESREAMGTDDEFAPVVHFIDLPDEPSQPDTEPAGEALPLDDTLRWSPTDGGDLVEHAFASLGARMMRRADGMPTADMRVLMRALSAGGTLMGSCTPEQAHAARTLIGQLLDATRQLEASTVVRPTPSVGLAALLGALRRNDPAEALRLWQRSSIVVPPGARRLMQALLDGARGGPESNEASTPRSGRTDAGIDWTVSSSAIVRGERDGSALLPVRFGLSLLTDVPEQLRLEQTELPGMLNAAAMSVARTPGAGLEGIRDGRSATPGSGAAGIGEVQGEATGIGWGGARAADLVHAQHRRDAEGAGARIVAVLCVALAVGASVLGFNAVAIALAVGAVWLGVRRSPGSRFPANDRT
ncbi:MAG TPA: tetratricopeptide repeat protein [Gemmatimonas sp.]|uniref:tetratricopeptide repeat protein n=1 Tax=Gemmatimonas sp. TaxID=1962908 RepID=UPI002ED8D063